MSGFSFMSEGLQYGRGTIIYFGNNQMAEGWYMDNGTLTAKNFEEMVLAIWKEPEFEVPAPRLSFELYKKKDHHPNDGHQQCCLVNCGSDPDPVDPTSPVPEPGTFAILLVCLLVLLLLRWDTKKGVAR